MKNASNRIQELTWKLAYALAALLGVAGLGWFGWTWMTAQHMPLPLLVQGWPAPVLFGMGGLLYWVVPDWEPEGDHASAEPAVALRQCGTPVARASVVLFERYHVMLSTEAAYPAAPEGCSRDHLLWMCATAAAQAATWPDDKTSRWLGFVQGVMTAHGLLTVAGERELSRPLFHAAYAEQGRPAPASVGKS